MQGGLEPSPTLSLFPRLGNKSFIAEQLALGNVDLGLDEALARWKLRTKE